VPSPPSAMGTHTTSAPGAAARTPRAIAAATSSAARHSLNESGAATTFTRPPYCAATVPTAIGSQRIWM